VTDPDAIRSVAGRIRAKGALTDWRVRDGEGAFWVEYSPEDAAARQAGTKIHVSAALGCAAEVLSRCAPILLDQRIAFKHAADLSRLSFLSAGAGGASQVGKFITAYPPDESAAYDIAGELHRATLGLRGPRVPHEQPFTEGSLVFFRFGSFVRSWLQMCSGRIVPAIEEQGEWRVDERAGAQQPSASHASGRQHLATGPVGGERVLRDRYVRVRPLFHSPKGSTHLGFIGDDGDEGRLVMIKEAYAHTMEDLRGVDARQRLRDEHRCLVDVEAAGIAPRAVDFWETADSAFLVYEPVEGATLTQVLTDLGGRGLRPSADLLRSWTISLCEVAQKLHDAGYVSCDIKPANIVMTEEGMFLIDLELAGPPSQEPTGGMGTQGYSSPQQIAHRQGRAVTDDVYSIGATMLAAATSSDASLLPDLKAVAALEATRSPDDRLYAAIERCVDPEPNLRPQSAAEIVAALEAGQPVSPGRSETAESDLEVAARIGDRILAATVRDGEHSWWLSNHSTMSGQAARDLYCGSAGIALYLCALSSESGRDEFLEEALRCGRWLWEADPPVPRRDPMPGLYFGECGAGLLYLELFGLTGEADWLDRAKAVGAAADALEVRSPDIMTGLAGVGWFQLALWRASGDAAALERVEACARELRERRRPDRPEWRFPEDFDIFGGAQYPGFAHGSAGIGYFLAEYHRSRPAAELADNCQEIAEWLVERAEPALADGSGLAWKVNEGRGSSYMCAWCHGAPGMIRFFLLAHEVTADERYLDAARRAASAVAHGAPWVGTTQCHGLAGNLEALLDLYLYTGEAEYLTLAAELGENLRAYETPAGWQSDELSTGCLDLMVGEAGVGAAFLRLANPGLPHLIHAVEPRPAGARAKRTPSIGLL
jgi:serine/threonine protein kinase